MFIYIFIYVLDKTKILSTNVKNVRYVYHFLKNRKDATQLTDQKIELFIAFTFLYKNISIVTTIFLSLQRVIRS